MSGEWIDKQASASESRPWPEALQWRRAWPRGLSCLVHGRSAGQAVRHPQKLDKAALGWACWREDRAQHSVIPLVIPLVITPAWRDRALALADNAAADPLSSWRFSSSMMPRPHVRTLAPPPSSLFMSLPIITALLGSGCPE